MTTPFLWSDDEEPVELPSSQKSRRQAAPGSSQSEPLTVTQLNNLIKQTLDKHFSRVWLEAEISELSRPQSGHVYLTLKDQQSQMRAVMWRSTAAKLPFRLEDGMQVMCCGTIDVYPPRGTYQLNIQSIEPKGVGSLQLAFRQLHAKLAAEGLFDPNKKKPLPPIPRRIGFVTSPTGAAVHDFLEVLRRRWNDVEVIIIPAKVQGEGSVSDVVKGIRLAAKLRPKLDVLVVGRGGGSLEDLWTFNEEAVVRAIVACPIPTVSAVGHEIDVTLADLAADVRALTPTEAAERIVPDQLQMMQLLQSVQRQLDGTVLMRLDAMRMRLEELASRPALSRPIENILRWEQRLDEINLRLVQAIDNRLTLRNKELEHVAGALEALSPLRVLGRGYTLTRDGTKHTVLRKLSDFRINQQIETTVSNGTVLSRVESIHPNS
jgi:exodeoxyribonuclease VII large subunit